MDLREAVALKINMIRLRAILRPDPSERFKAMSLRDLDARVKLMESTPWEPDLVAELSEKRYREGYRDGFIAAVKAYRRLLSDDEALLTPHHGDIYYQLLHYWNRLLGIWEHADCSQRTHFGVNEQPFEQGGDLPPTIGEK